MGCGLGPVFLGPDLLCSFVVAVVTVQRSSVPSMVSCCACPQAFSMGEKRRTDFKKGLTDHPPEGIGKKGGMPSTRHTHTTTPPSSCWKTRMQRSTGASPCMHSPISASTPDLPLAWSSSEKICVGRRKRLQDLFQAGDNVHRGEIGPWAREHCSTQLQCRPAPWPFTLLFLSQ